MKRVYECSISKKGELMKALEADSFAPDSFARIGYKLREGASLGEDKEKLYLYISASDENVKKADERLKELAAPLEGEKEKNVLEKILAEEENAESGFGSMFG